MQLLSKSASDFARRHVPCIRPSWNFGIIIKILAGIFDMSFRIVFKPENLCRCDRQDRRDIIESRARGNIVVLKGAVRHYDYPAIFVITSTSFLLPRTDAV
jgi:hypothetical protein